MFTSIGRLPGAGARAIVFICRDPWKLGAPSQGYQLPLTPAQLYRAGIEATNAHCRKTYGKSFDRIEDAQRQEVLIGLSAGRSCSTMGCRCGCSGPTLYQTVVEGIYSDPIYGGKPQQGGLGDHRFSRGHRGASRSRRAISRQAVPEQARSASRT